jgi:hypothetical protein
MKLKARPYWFALLLLVMFAVPAFAQFEVSPDHFDDNPSSSPKVAHSNSAANLKLQIAEHKKLLANFQDRLLEKSALVAKARQTLKDSGSVTARNDFLKQKSELRELRQSLAVPVQNAQLALARLERQRQVLRAAARRRDTRSSSGALLSASK